MITETKLYAGGEVIAEMKTIKIIDLLLKISKDEEVPKRIKYKNKIYHYRGDDYATYDENWLFSENYTEKTAWLKDFLNEEVEILDEPKENKIEKIVEGNSWWGNSATGNEATLKMKINELIDEVNKLI